MSRFAKQLLGVAAVAGILGGVLAFALEDENATAAGLELRALGLVLLAVALVLAAGAAISSVGSEKGEPLDVESTRTITGLVAVVAGIVAVSAIAIVTATLLGAGDNRESTVAITTSALGIISTFVTAYLGIKATANTSDKATAAAAKMVDKLTPDSSGGGNQSTDPPQGGGGK